MCKEFSLMNDYFKNGRKWLLNFTFRLQEHFYDCVVFYLQSSESEVITLSLEQGFNQMH